MGSKWLIAVNPLLKIGLCIFLTTWVFVLKSFWSNLLLLSVLLAVLFLAVPVRPSLVRNFLVIMGLFTLFTGLIFQDFGYATLNALRLSVLFLPAPLLAATTAPSDLVRALQAVRLPPILILSLMLTWRFLPIIQQELQRIVEANQLRGVDLLRMPNLWFSGLFTPLIFRIVSYADEITIGLETRGYDPTAPRSTSRSLTWQTSDTQFVLASVTTILAVGYAEWLNFSS